MKINLLNVTKEDVFKTVNTNKIPDYLTLSISEEGLLHLTFGVNESDISIVAKVMDISEFFPG